MPDVAEDGVAVGGTERSHPPESAGRPGVIERIRKSTAGYNRPFWLLFWGTLIARSGSSMVWPFLTIYLRQRLQIPLTQVAALLTVNAAVSLVATSIAGPIVDRFGRKGAMVVGLAAASLNLLAMSTAGSYGLWIGLMAIDGAFSPLYQVGSQAMVADLVEPDRRAGAYALLRMSANLGVAIGPSVGGFITVTSYALAFYIAFAAEMAFAVLILLSVPETVPAAAPDTPSRREAGYGPVLRDRPFLAFCSVSVLAGMTYSLMMILLPVYAKENFGVPENQYGFIMATNAAMVVLLQYTTTRITSRYSHLPVLAAGSLFYALGVGSVAWGWSFPTFLASMVILTIGEMIMIPTSTALTANLAPADMRGRYMGIFGLTWSVAFGVGPVLGGYLNDTFAPVAIWHGGLVMGLAATLGFLFLARALRRPSLQPAA
jgi:MFS family permease